MKKLPTWVEIDLDALLHNIGIVRSAVGDDVQLLLTIKADAYGHGAVQVAQATHDVVDRFGVATVDEALELRHAGINNQILILSPILGPEIPVVVENGFAVTVPSLEFAQSLSAHAASKQSTIEIHIEVDTGMGRTGFVVEDAKHLVREVSGLPGLNVDGLFTHFPSSDDDDVFTETQLKEFTEFLADLEREGVSLPLVHCANSAAIARLPASHKGMVRPGLIAYGHCPGGKPLALAIRPVMSWKSRLVQVRRVSMGRSISYGRSFVTKRDTILGIVPTGYGHGYPFQLSNSGEMLVGDSRVPVLGRVTMDMTMVDLTDVPGAPVVGDEVVLMGEQGSQAISLDDIAQLAGTINYEVLCGISKRVPRVYIRGGRVESIKSLLGVDSSRVSS